MGIGDSIGRGLRDLHIARPDEAAGRLAHRHPHKNIPSGARLTVRSDEKAVFFRDGRLAGELAAGAYQLDTANIPFLGPLFLDRATGGNHYVTDLFFVLTKEYMHRVDDQRRKLGSYLDARSDHLVEVFVDAHFGIRVADPVAFITKLAGLSPAPDSAALEFVDARLCSRLQEVVGTLFHETHALDVVSNRFSDRIGREVRELCRDEFTQQGLEITRFLRLALELDEASGARLREFGEKLSEIRVSERGAAAAGSWHAYVAAQAHHEVARGLGAGLAKGDGPMLLTGGLSGFPPPMPATARAAHSPGPGPVAASLAPIAAPQEPLASLGARWHLRTATGIEGPLTARQVATTSIAHGFDVATAQVRRANETVWRYAADDPALVTEFERRERRPGFAPPGPDAAAIGAFERAFHAACADGRISDDEMRLLVQLAVALGVATTEEGAADTIRRRAAAAHVETTPPAAPSAVAQPSPPRVPDAPPPPPIVAYRHFDGTRTTEGLSAESVARRVVEHPDGVHVVWAPGFDAWRKAREVPEIAAAIAALG